MTILYQENVSAPKQTPANSKDSNVICSLVAAQSRCRASDGGPRGGGPRGAAALMRRDAPRPSRTWHAPSAWRYARVGVPRAPSGRAVRRARAVRCARHGGPRRALLQHVLRVAVLDAAGRCRAERRCVGRCASPWTGRLGSRHCVKQIFEMRCPTINRTGGSGGSSPRPPEPEIFAMVTS